jgi:hypothetical protein
VSAADIDGYVAGLAAALRGPRRVRDDLLTEARDGLVDAAEAYQESGLEPGAAQRRAVEEFGGYAEVVPDYQAELAVAQGRRTALLIALALPALHLLAPLMWWHSPWATDQLTGGYARLTAMFDYLSLDGGAVAAVVLLGFGWGSRYVRNGVRLTHAVGYGGLTFLLVHGLDGLAVYLWSLARWPGAVYWPPMWAGAVVMLLAFGYAALAACRCVWTSRAQFAAARRLSRA